MRKKKKKINIRLKKRSTEDIFPEGMDGIEGLSCITALSKLVKT